MKTFHPLFLSTFCLMLGLLLMPTKNTTAQTLGTNVVTSDFESWISAGVKLKIHKKFTIELSEELRLMKNSSQVDQFFTNLDLGYAPLKFLEFGTGFRFIQSGEEDGAFSSHYRIHVDVAFKHKLKRFDFKYRLRYQFKNEIGKSFTDGDYFKHGVRLKAAVGYNVKKINLEPKIAVELFSEYEKYTLMYFSKMRITAALAYDFKKLGKLTAFFSVEPEIYGTYPKTTSIVGLNYTYTINLPKKKK